MPDTVAIALDVMGGDHGTDAVLPAAIQCVSEDPFLRLILLGDSDHLRKCLQELPGGDSPQLVAHHAPGTIAMDDALGAALRRRDTSMRRGLELLHEGEAQAFVSAGNTGALVGLSHYVIGMLPGLERPALQATIPSVKGHTHVLDLGGNVDCSAELLVQFAAMGLVLAQELDANQNPRVGLLNVGAEAIKGSAQVQAADVLLRDSSLASSYIGFVEGDDIYLGDVDIVVCDGFAGNILLKASEGGARMFSHFLMREFKASLLRRAVLAISAPLLRSFRRRMDPRRYNGASLLGLREIVIKSHGGADSLAVAHAIRRARHEVDHRLPERIYRQIGDLLPMSGQIRGGRR